MTFCQFSSFSQHFFKFIFLLFYFFLTSTLTSSSINCFDPLHIFFTRHAHFESALICTFSGTCITVWELESFEGFSAISKKCNEFFSLVAVSIIYQQICITDLLKLIKLSLSRPTNLNLVFPRTNLINYCLTLWPNLVAEISSSLCSGN